jgi:uncharacterized OsmC-like protein
MADLVFKVSAQSESPARVRVSARDFSLIIDEPPALGGDDHGANPVEFILAGLVGCLNVVAHLVAKELGIVVRSLKLDAEGPVNPERLLNVSFAERAGYKAIRVKVEADTDADPATLERWRSIVESRCPVSDNLINATPVRLELRRAEAASAVA